MIPTFLLGAARGERKSEGRRRFGDERDDGACLSSWLPWMKMHDGEEIDGLGLKCRILCWAARSRKIWAHVGPCQTEIKINDRLVELYTREKR
jgi:hypothetical protein